MKNKFTARLCVFMCLVLVISTFAACSVKDKTKDNTETTLTPDNQWYAGNGVYEPVTIGNVELVELVNQALGEEAKDFTGDLNSLTPEQIEKVENLAADKGLIVEKDESGNTVIKEYEVPTTQASKDEYNEIMSQASVVDPSNVSPSEYAEISKVASQNGMSAVTKPDSSKVEIIKPVTTKPQQQVPPTAPPVITVPNGGNQGTPATPNATTNTTKRNDHIAPPTTYRFTAGPTAGTTKPVPMATSGWVNTYGGSSNDLLNDSAVTSDGGVVSVGITFSPEGRSQGSTGTAGMILKYNEKGKLQWSKLVDGDNSVAFESVAVLKDGSIIVAGYTNAQNFVNDAEYMAKGTLEGFIIKYDNSGKEVWRKIIGGSAGDMIYAVAETPDGGFVIGGKSESADGHFKDVGTKLRKAFMFKCDANGGILWRQALSGSKHCAVEDMKVNNAGEVFAVISSASADGEFADLEGAKTGRRTTVVVKLGNGGNIQWRKSYYESGIINMNSIELSNDGGCVIAGQYSAGAEGNQFSFKGIYNGGTVGTFDGMIIKLDATGVTRWLLPLIGFENDFITDITKIDGGYAVSGYTASSNRDFSIPNSGNYDGFVYTVSEGGKAKSIHSFGGTFADQGRAICSNGSSLYVCGATNSADGFFANCDVKGKENSSVAFVSKFELTV